MKKSVVDWQAFDDLANRAAIDPTVAILDATRKHLTGEKPVSAAELVDMLDADIEYSEERVAIQDEPSNAPSDQQTSPSFIESTAETGMKFIGMRELLNEPEEKTTWLVDGLLIMGGDSLCVAKPKVGKSTLARCLALHVARGEDFLGRKTSKGPVFYLALEEKKAEVRRHFIAMGATEEDQIFLFCASSPADGLEQLREAMKLKKPILVIVDPLFRFVRVKDGNDYNAVTNALEPLHSLARESGAHVMAAHHAGKAGDRDGGDSVLGSTAIFAAVDTLLVMKRHDKYRTLSSIQRYGTDLEEITLTYDEQARTLTPGVARADADVTAVTKDIVDFLNTQSEPVEEKAIHEAVEGRRALKQQALRRSVNAGTTIRTGTGKKGDSYRYQNTGTEVQPLIAGTTVPESLTLTNEKQNAGTGSFVQDSEPEIPGNHLFDDSEESE